MGELSREIRAAVAELRPHAAGQPWALAEAGAQVLPAPAEAATAAMPAEGTGLSPEDSDPGLLDFVVEATALPACPASLAETAGLEEALLGAARSFATAVHAASRLTKGGVLLCVSAPQGPTPEDGWIGPLLAWRAAAVAGLARELAPKGVRVAGLAPVLDGGARLPGFLKRGAPKVPPTTPLGRAADPAEVAEAALWLLGAGMVTGITLPLDGGRGL
jgi:NAD(P)-dependent dehydrogenase (short-subunit alcohol dehydrogenase family)